MNLAFIYSMLFNLAVLAGSQRPLHERHELTGLFYSRYADVAGFEVRANVAVLRLAHDEQLNFEILDLVAVHVENGTRISMSGHSQDAVSCYSRIQFGTARLCADRMVKTADGPEQPRSHPRTSGSVAFRDTDVEYSYGMATSDRRSPQERLPIFCRNRL